MPGFVDVSGMSDLEIKRLGQADDDYEPPRKRYSNPPPVSYTADQIWGLAVAADRINGGYVKMDQYDFHVDQRNPVKRANKMMIKDWLRQGSLDAATAADVEQGRKYRDHFKSYTLMLLAGKLNEFQQTAMKIAAKDSFTGRDMYDFAVIGCLPEVARRDQQRSEVKREVFASEQLQGLEGDVVQGEITVIQCRFNPNYGKYRITARMGESFIDFWFSKELAGELTIKGKIKRIRGDKTTQLNYVKRVG